MFKLKLSSHIFYLMLRQCFVFFFICTIWVKDIQLFYLNIQCECKHFTLSLYYIKISCSYSLWEQLKVNINTEYYAVTRGDEDIFLLILKIRDYLNDSLTELYCITYLNRTKSSCV